VVVTAPPARQTTPAPADVTGFATVLDTSNAPTGVTTLADTLSTAPGVQVREYGGLGSFSTVSVRGFSPGQVQVYLDGVPLSRANDEVVNLSDLPLDAIDRVEVYRGVTPLVFAQSGPGGVVNLVPRQGGAEPVTAASASYGSFDTRKVDLARSASDGPWDYLAFGQYFGSRGNFTFLNDQGTPENTADDVTEQRINNAFNSGSFTGRIGYHPPGPLSFWLTSDSFGKSQGVPGRGSVQSPDAHRDIVRQLAQLGGRLTPTTGLPLTIEASTFLVYQDEHFEAPPNDPVFLPTDVTEHTLGGGGQVLVRGALGAHNVPALLLAVGEEALRENNGVAVFPVLQAGESPTRTQLRGTVAAEDEVLLLGDRVSLVPAVRTEIYRDHFPADPRLPPALRTSGTDVFTEVSPRFGVRAEALPGLTLLGNIGRYTRVPNLQELFGNSGVVQGNPDLKPEVSRNWDVGFRAVAPPWGPFTSASFEYGHFDNRIDDLIVLVPSSVSVFKPMNIANARVQGNEIAVQAQLWGRLGLTANFTQQNAREISDIPFRNGNQLPGRPAEEAYARLDLTWSPAHPLPLGAALAGLWPGRLWFDANLIADNFLDTANTQLVPSRSLFGIGVEMQVPPLHDVTVGLAVRNLTDDKTEDVLGFPLPGRSVFATVSWGFARHDK
jgi:outer membrane receptor protein involved in Fe transport